MEYIDGYRNPDFAKGLLEIIAHLASADKEITVMEVCGSHTQAIGRHGIRGILPPNIRLISGPGCPVCVTGIDDVDVALFLAELPNVIFVTFGDMLRVPGTSGATLQEKRAAGANVVVICSAMEGLAIAKQNPEKKVVMMGIGFETTIPTIAASIKRASREGIRNLCLFSAHKVVPPALKILVGDPCLKIDGFLCPGHVSSIIGSQAYSFITEADKAAVVTGFESVDILEGIMMILQQLTRRDKQVVVQYSRGVSYHGNRKALALMEEVFVAQDATWRGMGTIPRSGLALRKSYEDFDVRAHFAIPELHSVEPSGCACGDILKGLLTPPECPLFMVACSPSSPVGPCMVSSEGTCAAYYRYQ